MRKKININIVNTAKLARREAQLKIRNRFKWIFKLKLDDLTHKFNKLEQSVFVGLNNIHSELKNVTNALHNGLLEIDQHFVKFETPIEKAANKIAKSFENYNKSEDMYHMELKNLIEELNNYSEKIVQTNQNQIASSKILYQKTGDLSKISTLLHDTIKIFGPISIKSEQFQKNENNKQNREDTIFGIAEKIFKQYYNRNETIEKLLNEITKKISHNIIDIIKQSEINKILQQNIENFSIVVTTMSKSIKDWEKVILLKELDKKNDKESSQQLIQLEGTIDKKVFQFELLTDQLKDLYIQNRLILNQIKIITNHLKFQTKKDRMKKKKLM